MNLLAVPRYTAIVVQKAKNPKSIKNVSIGCKNNEGTSAKHFAASLNKSEINPICFLIAMTRSNKMI